MRDLMNSCGWYVPRVQVTELFGVDLGEFITPPAAGVSTAEDIALCRGRASSCSGVGLNFRGYPARCRLYLNLHQRTLYRCLDPDWFLWTGQASDNPTYPSSPGTHFVGQAQLRVGVSSRADGLVPEKLDDIATGRGRPSRFQLVIHHRDRHMDSSELAQHVSADMRLHIMCALTPVEVMA